MKSEIRKGDKLYEIRRAKAEDVDTLKLLCDETLGENFYSRGDILTLVEDKGNEFYLLTDGAKTVGFHLHYVCTLSETAEKLRCDLSEMEKASGCAADERVGVLKSIGITVAYRGGGLASTFNEYAIENLFGMGLRSIWVPAWKRENYIPENNTLIRQGFRPFCNVEKFWYDKENLNCPACKSVRCVCDAMIYYSVLPK